MTMMMVIIINHQSSHFHPPFSATILSNAALISGDSACGDGGGSPDGARVCITPNTSETRDDFGWRREVVAHLPGVAAKVVVHERRPERKDCLAYYLPMLFCAS